MPTPGRGIRRALLATLTLAALAVMHAGPASATGCHTTAARPMTMAAEPTAATAPMAMPPAASTAHHSDGRATAAPESNAGSLCVADRAGHPVATPSPDSATLPPASRAAPTSRRAALAGAPFRRGPPAGRDLLTLCCVSRT